MVLVYARLENYKVIYDTDKKEFMATDKKGIELSEWFPTAAQLIESMEKN